MENNENITNNSSFCKICSQNGFPNIRIFWKSVGEKEHGTPKWVPHEDIECSLRHVHRQLGTEANQAALAQSQASQSHNATEDESAMFSYQYEYLANVDVIATLTTVLEENRNIRKVETGDLSRLALCLSEGLRKRQGTLVTSALTDRLSRPYAYEAQEMNEHCNIR